MHWTDWNNIVTHQSMIQSGAFIQETPHRAARRVALPASGALIGTISKATAAAGTKNEASDDHRGQARRHAADGPVGRPDRAAPRRDRAGLLPAQRAPGRGRSLPVLRDQPERDSRGAREARAGGTAGARAQPRHLRAAD